MIIIAENKKNHYLIKKFLIESGIDRDHNDVQLNLRPVPDTEHESDPRYYVQQDLEPVKDVNIYTDADVVLPSDRKFKELVDKAPKYNKLKNLAIKGMLTLAMVGILWNSIPRHLDNPIGYKERQTYSAEQKSAEDQVESELINQNPEEEENIATTFDSIQNNEEEDLVFSIEYDTSIDKKEIKKRIIKHEGFRELPYPDHHQWSIGHGTKVFSDADLSEGEHEKFKSDYEKAVDEDNLAEWVEKTIPGWREKFIETYSIQDDNLSKESPISIEQAGIAADAAINYAITKMQEVEYFSVLPSNIKNAFFDMAYNMGPGFLKKFKNFNAGVKHAAIALNSPELNEAEAEVAINLLEIAAEEIIHNFNDDGTLRGKTKYHRDLGGKDGKKGRSDRNYDLVKRGIEDIKIVISPSNFANQKSNESLKRVYQHLFV